MNIIQMIIAIFEKLFTKKEQHSEEKVETVDLKNESVETTENSVEKVEETTKKVKLDTYIVGENITITEDTYYTYKVKLLNKNNNNPILNKTIQLKINDKNYIYNNSDGTYTLPLKLDPGTYTLASTFDGDDICNPSKVTTTVVVEKKKQEIKCNDKGEYWNPRYLTGTSLKQINSYFCAPVSITQVWYELFGTDESQTEISKYASTTVAGTSHAGINTALQKLANKYNKRISIQWKNYSSMTLQELGEIVADPNRALILHVMWHNINNWNDKGGHYTTLACVNPKKGYVYEIYSLSGPELIKRTSDYMKTVTSEISQQSVCIITKQENKTTNTTTKTNNDAIKIKMKGLFIKSSDSNKISFTELKNKGYNKIFLSHMVFEDYKEDYIKKFSDKCHNIGAKLVIFYTTYYNGSGMVNPTSSEAKSRIQKIISIGKKDCVDGVCLDYNRHNSNNHNDGIMNTITANTNKVVSELKGKEVYATCMYEHPDTLKNYYHQDIGKWKATPLPMAYKYNYNYTDYKMNEMKQLIQKTNNKSILIFQNYFGDNNIRDIGSSQLQQDIQSCKVKDFIVFRYGTGAI